MIFFRRIYIVLIFILFFTLSSPFFVSASNLEDAFKVNDGSTSDPLDEAAGKAGYDTRSGQGALTVEVIISRIVQVALALVGIIFLILMIYGGYMWMTAHGNEEQVTKAKSLITAAIIGLIIVVSAYAITYFVVEAFGTKTLTPASS